MWTKAEMSKLTVEQQDVVARLELSVARQREQLLKEARGHGSWLTALLSVPYTVTGIGLFVVAFLPFLAGHQGAIVFCYILYAFLGLLNVYALIYLHTSHVHQRLDALLKLLDLDHKKQDDNKNSEIEKAG